MNSKGKVNSRKPVQARPVLEMSDRKYRYLYEEKLRALHQHALLLSSTSNMDEILDRTMNAMEYALGFDVADVYLAEGGSLNVKRTKGLPMGLSAVKTNGRSLVAKAARSKATVRVSDTSKEADYADRKGWDWNGPPTMLSEIAVPIVIDGKTAGVLNVENARLEAFNENDQMLLETLAAHFAIQMQRLKHLQELQRSRQFLETIIENANVWLNVLDNGSNVMVWNKAAEVISGYSREEVIGHNEIWSKLLPDIEYRKQIDDSVAHVLRNGRIEGDIETNIRCKDGQNRIISWDERNLLDEHGKVVGAVAIGRDITKRKRVEEALRESEQRLRRITDNMLDMVVETDLQGVCRYASPSCKNIMGYDPRDMVGKTLFDFVHPEDLDNVIETVRKAQSTGRLWTGGRFECRYRHADGHYVWLENMANFVYDEKGQMIGSVIGSRGITERKRIEEALAKERNVLRTLIDNLPDIVYIKDLESRFMTTNIAHVHHLRAKTLDEIVGKTDFDLYPREIAASYYHDEQAAMRSGQPMVNREERTVDAEGKTRWLLTTKVPLRDDNGRVMGIAGIGRDITERKRAEEALANERNVLRQLIDNLPDNIFVKDAQSRFLMSNQAHARLLRAKSPEDIVGKTDFDIFPRELAASYYEDEQAVMQSGQPLVNREERTVDPEGKTRWLLTTKVPLRDDHGNIIGVAGINRDITERKRMQEELERYSKHLEELVEERTRKLRQAERLAAVGETAAMVGHDLRNPLQGIAGAAYNMRRHLRNGSDPLLKEMLAVIDNGVEYANKIINDLLDFSREIQLQRLPTAPKEIVTMAIKDVQIPENVRVEDTTANAPQILADAPKIRRVLTNLIKNAVDAMPDGGKLSISSVSSQNELSISVRDTGVGIADDEMKRVWTPLHTTKARGIGLGLSICKRIMEAHGGSISVESAVGKGTTFTLKFPVEHAQGGE